MSEQDMRRHVISALRPLDAVSVENHAYPGTPDINFIEGWVELKWIRNWPVREESVVKIEHFTPQQRVWLRRRHHWGGNAWLLLCAQRDWLLFDGETAGKHVGLLPRAGLEKAAHRIWAQSLNEREFLDILSLTRKGKPGQLKEIKT